MVIEPLSAHPHLADEIGRIYFQEWGWHFADEWFKYSVEDIVQDLRENYMDATYVGLENGELVGTVALLDQDLKARSDLGPWATCLYVRPPYRNMGYGRELLDHVGRGTTYLWCSNPRERDMYQRWGFSLVEELPYDGAPAYVMVREAKI